MRYSNLNYAERMQALATIAAGFIARGLGQDRGFDYIADRACKQLAALEKADDAAMSAALGPKVPIHRL